MSWADELLPAVPTPWRVARDLAGCWRLYGEARLPLRRRFAFLTLRLVQRLAYWTGWTAGSLAVATVVPDAGVGGERAFRRRRSRLRPPASQS